MRRTQQDGIVAMIDRHDIDPRFGLHCAALIAQPFTEWAFTFSVTGMDEALDYDFGIGGEGQTGVFAGNASDRLCGSAHHV